MTRFTETKKWADPWFRGLAPDCKLAFLYIIDNCDNAGFWEIDLGMMAFQTGVDERGLQGALKGLARGLVVSNGWAWVRNFLRHQRNERLSLTNPAHKQIVAILVSQKSRFPEILSFLEGRGLEGAIKGLLSPIGTGRGNSVSSEGSPEGNQKDPCTLDQAKSAAPMCGMTDTEAETWWHARRANNWMKGMSGGGVTRIGPFQSDMKQSVGWVREQIAKHGANGKKEWKPNL